MSTKTFVILMFFLGVMTVLNCLMIVMAINE